MYMKKNKQRRSLGILPQILQNKNSSYNFLRAKKKVKAYSFYEIILTISISLILSSILFVLIFSINKSFMKITDNLKHEKKVEIFKNLLNSYIEDNKSLEVRLLNIKSDSAVPSFKDIFRSSLIKLDKEKTGNFLIIKTTNLLDIENKEVEINYRIFFFDENKLKFSCYVEGDIETLGYFSSQNKLMDNCEGYFKLFEFESDKNLLKIFLKNLDLEKGKKYEFSIYF